MASKSLGTLTLDLIAKIGGFTGPLDKASRSAQKSFADIKVSTVAAGVAIGEFAVKAAEAAPGALKELITGAADSAKEIANLSRIAGLSTTDFQKLSAGAATVGVGQEKLSDILKDVNDKVGDFLNTGGGELQDFFTNIAPKVGVTADQFRNLNSADALQLYISSLQKANASQSEMTFYLEAIANDATGLVPIFKDNGAAIKEFGDQAERTGAILDAATIQSATEFSNQMLQLGQYVDSAKVSLAAEFLPVISQFAKDVNQAAIEAGGLGEITKDLGDKVVAATAFIVNAGDGVVRVFDVVSNTLVGAFSTAVGHITSLGATANTVLGALTFGDTSAEFKRNAEDLANDAQIQFGIAAQAAQGINDAITQPLAGDKFKDYVKDAQAAAEAVRLFGDEPGSNGGKGTGVDGTANKAATAAAKEAGAAQKKISDAYKDTATDLQRQIELINTSTDATKNATEADKLHFELASGKLVGINAEQQKRLESLAAELDKLEKLKRANEDNGKAAAFAANLASENQGIKSGFDQQLAGAGLGDKAKERLQNDLAIQQDYYEKQAELQQQYNSGDISAELYAKETAALSDALAERMVLQQDYYNRLDEAQADWQAGVSSAWQNYVDEATNYQQQAADATASILDDTTSAVKDSIDGVLRDTESIGDAVTNLMGSVAESVLGVLEEMAARWIVTHALQMAGIEAETAATVASEGTKAAAVVSAEATKTAAKVATDTTSTASTLASLAATTTASVASAVEVLASWAPAALVASVGSFGAAAVVGGAALVAAYALTKGFRDGGYTGDGPADQVAGVVHAGEFVMTAEATKKIGVRNLQAMMGMAHDGLDSVPETGTWLLQKGERVTTAETSAKLDKTLSDVQRDRSDNSSAPTINLIEDSSKAGRTQQRDVDGERMIDIFISDLYSDGRTMDALTRKTGLVARGT